MHTSDNPKRFRLTLIAAALAIAPLGAHAAGLGRLTVISALGQPLRAEIEVTASRDELSSLSARLASAEAFKTAGIEFTPALSGIRLAVDKRPNGKTFIVATTERPFNEPFVDMLIQADWASGRLVREYTFLLDPPDVFKKAPAPAVPVAVPEVKKEAPAAPAPQAEAPAAPSAAEAPVAPAPAAPVAPAAPAPAPAPEPQAPAPAPAPVPEQRATPAPAPAPAPAAAAAEKAKPAAKPSAAATSRQVAKGDTLGKIANEVRPAGVSLDQMLAALFLNNKDAFDGGNMNRLRAGKILAVPDKDTVAAVEPAEARKMVVAQANDFNAYRKKLASAVAAAPAKEEAAAKQAAGGKIAPKVEEKAPPAPAGKDKLEVSRTEAGKGAKGGARLGAVEEDLIARDKELKEANGRIAALEKNLTELKKLADMKAAAGAKPQEAAPPAKPAEPPKPAPALAVPAKPVEPPKVEAPKPPEPPKAAESPKPAPAPKPAVKAPEPPPPPPGFIEENPEIVLGGGAILALLATYLGLNAWRRKRQAAAADADIGEAASSSVFGAAGGQSVDTGAALPTDFSQQAGLTSAGDEEVDPVQEADVYIAYGRDTQAEDILLAALKTDPTRCAIYVKLLEIYAARKDLTSFESVARELHGLTGGTGPDWERAVLLGRSIDPVNPLYGGAPEAPAAPAPEPAAAATVVTTAEALQPPPEPTPEPPAPVAEETPPPEEIPATLDFDLDLGTTAEPEAAPETAVAEAAPAAPDEGMSLDFDLGSLGETPAAPAAAEAPAALDFELDTPAPAEPAAEVAAAPADSNALDFDFDLSEPAAPAPEAAAPEATAPEAPPLDLSGISLELDQGAPAAAEAPAAPEPTPEVVADLPPLEPAAAEPVSLEMPALEPAAAEPEVAAEPMVEAATVADDPEVATKLELAQAYEEMGDKEGARELLNEVLNEGSPSQQEAARQKLAALA